MRRLAIGLALLSLSCGGDSSPASPSTAAPSAAPTLSGTIASVGGVGIANATVTFLDGQNLGRTATSNASGAYSFQSLAAGNGNLAARAGGYIEDRRGISLAAGPNTLSFTLQPAPLFSVRGTGNNVFEVPSYVTRVRITGSYSGSCQNFVMRIGGRLIVNEILGTCSVASGRSYDGTHQLQTPGGTGETTSSTNINWTVTEVR